MENRPFDPDEVEEIPGPPLWERLLNFSLLVVAILVILFLLLSWLGSKIPTI